MGRYAVIDLETNKVLNCIEWDEKDPWTPCKGSFVVKSNSADIGDLFLVETNQFLKKNLK